MRLPSLQLPGSTHRLPVSFTCPHGDRLDVIVEDVRPVAAFRVIFAGHMRYCRAEWRRDPWMLRHGWVDLFRVLPPQVRHHPLWPGLLALFSTRALTKGSLVGVVRGSQACLACLQPDGKSMLVPLNEADKVFTGMTWRVDQTAAPLVS